MASRFGHRDARTSLFAGYDDRTARTQSQSPSRLANGYPSSSSNRPTSNPAFGAYPTGGGPGGYASTTLGMSNGQDHHFRSATPNRRGQYSDAVLSELESQNNDELAGMSAKVKMLKDITSAIGDEIRDSTKLAETMNNTFENTSVKLKGTMNRMLRMAERTGVGWKVWVLFFLAVILLFWYVKLF